MAGNESWESTTIGDLLRRDGGSIKTGPFGTILKAKEYSNIGVPLISVGEVRSGSLRVQKSTPKVPRKVVDRLPEYVLEEGDIVFGRKGSVDRSAFVKAEQAGWFLGSDGIRLRPPKTCNALFVAYHFQSPATKSWLIQHSTGTTMASLNQGTIERVPILLPPLREQLAISHILGTIDDKIELNRRMNETLEAMVRAIFKSWFIDFDPVRAKMAGRPTGLSPEIEELFPDGMVDSELGEIPRGWKVCPFSGIVRIIGGGTPKTSVQEYWNGEIPWFSVADAPSEGEFFVINTEKRITQKGFESSAACLIKEGATIISARGTVGKLALVGVPMAINQSCYGLYGVEAGSAFIYCATHSLVSVLKQRSHGSVFNTITRDTLSCINYIAPTKIALDSFERVVDPFMKRIKNNLFESCTLSDLRDMLLPKLISGKLRILNARRYTPGNKA